MRKKWALAIGAVAAVLALAGGAVAYATGHDSEGGASGPGADRAVQAALDSTGGGTANAVELDSANGGKWEVEVAKTDGSVVDVYVDENHNVIATEGDSESPDGGDSGQ